MQQSLTRVKTMKANNLKKSKSLGVYEEAGKKNARFYAPNYALKTKMLRL